MEINPTPSDLVPILWDAPNKPFHLKACNADHFFARTNFPAYLALPKHQQRRAIFVCKKCGGEVAWADSKSGKKYLCDITHQTFRYGRRGKLSGTNWFYNPHLWHSKTCKPTEDGSIHPTAIAHEERTARLRKERTEKEASK